MEFVWVVPRGELFTDAAWNGFRPFKPGETEREILVKARAEGFFMERRYAEVHPEFKQPIPYVLVVRKTGKAYPNQASDLASSDLEVLHLKRLRTQTEARLHGLESIGVGGHINPCDAPDKSSATGLSVDRTHDFTGGDLFENACLRELHEELVLPKNIKLSIEPLGLLNDDTTEVGAVHLGLVYLLNATGMDVRIREVTAMTGQFAPLPSLQQAAQESPSPFESWSTLLLRSNAFARREMQHA